MRSPGVIYRRYRQIKRKILYDKIGEKSLYDHSNCHYGKTITYTDEQNIEHTIKVCNYNSILDEGRIEICNNPTVCSAYVNKWNRNLIIKEIEKELSDHKIKKKLYPELTILEWALDKDLNDAIKNPGFFGNIIIGLIEFLEGILKSK
jgi:hypothetical protein